MRQIQIVFLLQSFFKGFIFERFKSFCLNYPGLLFLIEFAGPFYILCACFCHSYTQEFRSFQWYFLIFMHSTSWAVLSFYCGSCNLLLNVWRSWCWTWFSFCGLCNHCVTIFRWLSFLWRSILLWLCVTLCNLFILFRQLSLILLFVIESTTSLRVFLSILGVCTKCNRSIQQETCWERKNNMDNNSTILKKIMRKYRVYNILRSLFFLNSFFFLKIFIKITLSSLITYSLTIITIIFLFKHKFFINKILQIILYNS